MKCIVLQNGVGLPLGFLLCSPDLGQPTGDCVFMPAPTRPNFWAGRRLLHLWQAGEEGRWEVEGREPLTVRVQASGPGSGLFVVIGGSAGGWGFDTGPARSRAGRAVLATEAEPLSWPTDLMENENPGSG